MGYNLIPKYKVEDTVIITKDINILWEICLEKKYKGLIVKILRITGEDDNPHYWFNVKNKNPEGTLYLKDKQITGLATWKQVFGTKNGK